MVELAVSKLLVDSDAAKLRLGNTASFEMSQRWLIVGNSVYDLTCPRYESPAFDWETNALPLDQLVGWNSLFLIGVNFVKSLPTNNFSEFAFSLIGTRKSTQKKLSAFFAQCRIVVLQ